MNTLTDTKCRTRWLPWVVPLFLLLTSGELVAQNNTISGTVFQDEDFDAIIDAAESGSGAIMVLLYRDVNQDGLLNGGDLLMDSVLSMPNGTFSFSKPFATNTVTRQITTSSDDAEERVSNGVMNLVSTDLEMIDDGFAQYVGMRFPNLALAQGTTITSAYIDFIVDEVQTGATSVTLRGQNADNATTFTTTAYNISGRPLTTASVAWNSIPSWSTIGATQTSPNISSIVQEIVNRAGWVSGNSMVVRVNGSGRRTAVAQELGTYPAPVLRINYSTGTNDYFLVHFDTTSIAPGAPISSPTTRAITFTGSGQTSANNDFGYLGLQSSCFVSADNGDALHLANRYTGSNRVIGSLGVPDVEAIALNISRDTLWAADLDQLGTVNMNTGAFTALPQLFGTGNGAWGAWALDDVDGLSYDPVSGVLWGSHREDAAMDLIFKINRNTGARVPNAFGAGVDYLVLNGAGMLGDLDDLAFNPTTGVLYATNNDGGGTTNLISINTTTGAGTIIANLGINDVEGQGFSNDGNFYATTGEVAAGTDKNSFWKISITTGALTKLSTFTSNGDFEGCDCLTGTAKNVITGTVYDDQNSDAVFNAGDIGYASAEIYLHQDVNEDQQWDPGDILDDSTLASAAGRYVYIRNFAIKYVLTINTATLPGSSSMTTDSLETAPFTGLGQFDINNNFGFDYGGSMPVELLSFEAVYSDGVVNLQWSTASEVNSSHYEIERSEDGSSHESIMSVAGTGTPMTRSDYEAIDENPMSGTSFYRLKQVDVDGSFEYAPWVKVNAPLTKGGFSVAPNPATNDVTIIFSGPEVDETSINVFDIRGAARRIPIVNVVGANSEAFKLDASSLEPGIYFVTATSGNDTYSRRLIVQ